MSGIGEGIFWFGIAMRRLYVVPLRPSLLRAVLSPVMLERGVFALRSWRVAVPVLV